MPSQTHRRRNKNRRQQRNSRNRARSSKLSLTNSEYGLGLAGSIVGVSALSQGSELIDQHNNEDPSQQMFVGGQGGGRSANASARAGSDSAEYILRFLEMLNTIKIYHWSTLSYPTHKATDELHSKMSELVDSFIEIYIGHLSRRGGGAGAGIPVFKRGAASEISFCECKSLDIFCKKLDGYITFMEGLTKRLDGYTDLVNIRDEMVGAVAQTLYLLRLS
jgi:hypothetical protein